MHLVTQVPLALRIPLLHDLSNGRHLHPWKQWISVNLIADDVHTFAFGEVNAHGQDIFANDHAGWIYWIRKKKYLGIWTTVEASLVTFLQLLLLWNIIIQLLGEDWFGLNTAVYFEVSGEGTIHWYWSHHGIAFIAEAPCQLIHYGAGSSLKCEVICTNWCLHPCLLHELRCDFP